MDNTGVAQKYLSLRQTSCYLGLAMKTVYVWAEDGKIPAYKLGRVWRFDREEVDAWVRRGTASKCYNHSAYRGIGRNGVD